MCMWSTKESSDIPYHLCTLIVVSSGIFLMLLNFCHDFINVLFFSMPVHVPYGLCGLPSQLLPKCNRLLRWGCPWGAVTLSRTRRGLNLSSTKLPSPWSPWESFPSRKNAHGRTRNQTWDLMISSQKLWLLHHEAGLINVLVLMEIPGLDQVVATPPSQSWEKVVAFSSIPFSHSCQLIQWWPCFFLCTAFLSIIRNYLVISDYLLLLTHCRPVTQICVFCVFALQLWKTDDANLPFNTRLVFTYLITQYIKHT
jgi:hypothetical protein